AVVEVEIANGDLRLRLLAHERRRGGGADLRRDPDVVVEGGGDHGRFILSRRRTARRAVIDSARIIITSRNAPAHACRCQSSYGEIAYVNTCTVSEAIGCTR